MTDAKGHSVGLAALKPQVKLTWSDERLLGFKPLDDIHEEFYEVVMVMLVCDEANVMAALDAFEAHALSHFGQEEQWMRESSFPATDCHADEHASVIRSLDEVRALISSGRANAALARDFAAYLLEWFPGHADYLDSALATWMVNRLYGGQPVVVRRTLG